MTTPTTLLTPVQIGLLRTMHQRKAAVSQEDLGASDQDMLALTRAGAVEQRGGLYLLTIVGRHTLTLAMKDQRLIGEDRVERVARDWRDALVRGDKLREVALGSANGGIYATWLSAKELRPLLQGELDLTAEDVEQILHYEFPPRARTPEEYNAQIPEDPSQRTLAQRIGYMRWNSIRRDEETGEERALWDMDAYETMMERMEAAERQYDLWRQQNSTIADKAGLRERIDAAFLAFNN